VSACAVCGRRKGRRACPAKGALICSVCCGTKRRVEIACPGDCVYLEGAHDAAWEGRETEKKRDARRLMPAVQSLGDTPVELFFLALQGVAAIQRRNPGLTDALLGQAVTAVRRSLETRQKGVLYEHAPGDLRAVPLVAEIRGIFEAKDDRGEPIAPRDADILAVLSALETALAGAAREGAGPRTLLDTIARMAGPAAAAPAPERRLILEP
jgi:hypothetical protein